MIATTITTTTTKPARTAITMAFAMGSAVANTTPNADDASSSRTTTGKISAATSTGWAAKDTTRAPIAMVTSADTAALTTIKPTGTATATMIAGTIATRGDNTQRRSSLLP